MKLMYLIVFILGAFLLNGCSTIGEVLNPYKSDFTCPQKEKGKCVPINQAYEESVEGSKKKKREVGKQESKSEGEKSNGYSLEYTKSHLVETKDVVEGMESSVEEGKTTFNTYEDEVFKKMANLLRDPVTPLIAPPHVMRVLFLSYKGEGDELFMPRFVYFFVDEPRWIMGDYILGKETE